MLALKMLNKLTVTELAEFSKLTKGYISQVKHGLRPPSNKLLQAIAERYGKAQRDNGKIIGKYIDSFLQSRRDGISPRTIEFYKCYLEKSLPALDIAPTAKKLNCFLNSLTCSIGGKHAYYRAMSVFYNWFYSPKSGYGDMNDNPILLIEPPKGQKLLCPV